ncbi:MAG TPA: hypothetical protein VJK51_03620 [Candidatus Nanoarchaeia archaeon]|nr:hypothetical protein [Candidatus Nanoarchaeia archaeon]
MNRKGFELAISTLVVFIIAVVVMIGLIIVVKGGFEKLGRVTEPVFDVAAAGAVKGACELACVNVDRLSYCCTNFTVGSEVVYCFDSRLGVSCSLDCEGIC